MIAAELAVLTPQEVEAILREAGLSGVQVLCTGFAFRGWLVCFVDRLNPPPRAVSRRPGTDDCLRLGPGVPPRRAGGSSRHIADTE